MDITKKYVAFLLLCHTGAALEIFGPRAFQATMGSTAQIPCSYTVEKPPVDPRFFAAFWYFHGKEILSYDDEIRTTNSRYSLNIEKALNGTVDLYISKISIWDAGAYTCSVLYSPVKKEKDIIVYIKVETASPRVVITDNAVGINEESVLRCSVTGFYPEDIDIKWFRGTERLYSVTLDGPWRNLNGTYNVDSAVTITPTEEDRERNFSCRVQHESLKDPLQKDFKLIYKRREILNTTIDTKQMPENQSPAIIIIIVGVVSAVVIVILVVSLLFCKYKNKRTSPDLEIGEIIVPKLTLNEEATLECTLRNYIQGVHNVTWYEKRIEKDNPIAIPKTDQRRPTSTEPDRQSGDRHTYKSYLTLRQVQQSDQGIKYICRVENSSSGQKMEKSTGWLNVTGILPDLKIGEIIVPKMILGKSATLECTLQNYIQGVHTVIWYEKKEDTELINAAYDQRRHVTIIKSSQPDDQQSYKTYLALTPVTRADDGIKYICSVQGPNSEEIIENSTGCLQVSEHETPGKINTQERRKEDIAYSSSGYTSTDEQEMMKTPQLSHKISAEQETEQLSEAEKIEITPKHRNSKGLCETLPDVKIGEIIVPELILHKRATLECTLHNYIQGVHTVIWYEKKEDTEPINAAYNQRRHVTIIKCSQSDDQQSYKTYLALTPVTRADDGIKYICRVQGPNSEEIIENSTGCLQVSEHETPGKINTQERRKEDIANSSSGYTSTHEQEMMKTPQRSHKISAEQETEQLLEAEKIEITPKHRNSKGLCETLPDVKIGEIIVPELILHKRAPLECTLHNYIQGVHTVIWYEKKEDTEPINAAYDQRRHVTIIKSSQPDDQQSYKTYLALTPVTRADDGIKYICRVQGPNSEEIIENSTGCLQVSEHETPGKINTQERRKEDIANSSSGYTSTHEQEMMKTPQRSHKISAEQETEQLLEAEKIEITPKHRNSKGLCETLPDVKIGEIIVPELILHKRATLECTLHNYIQGVHTVIWYEKKEDTEPINAAYDQRRHVTIIKSSQPDDQQSYKTYLALTPVTRADDGIKYICRVQGPNSEEIIENSTGCLQVSEHETPGKINTQERRKEDIANSSSGYTSTHEQEMMKTPQRSHKISAEQETEQLLEAEKIEITPKHRNSKGLCETLPDVKIGEIIVPELILHKRATLECTLHNYIQGVHTVIWYEKKEDTEPINAAYNQRRHVTIIKCSQSDDQQSYKTYLALTPVTRADDGIKYICRVQGPNSEEIIENSTGCLQVSESFLPQSPRSPQKEDTVETPELTHETSIDQENGQLRKDDNHENTKVMGNGNSTSTREDAEKLSKEENKNEKTSTFSDKPCNDEESELEENCEKLRRTSNEGLYSTAKSPEDTDNEETRLSCSTKPEEGDDDDKTKHKKHMNVYPSVY
ncbi:uncharacterized protein RB166_016019 [Leptodactylus fuscus]|uniref:uncharacterized protein LOC142217150 n=1 Tax=Leptodactylus fuscus TaxID=238119 RepID=UPI003F4F29DD